MNRRLSISLVVLALGLLAGPATAAIFDNEDISARARGMGDAAVAVADDAFAPYFNPAGLAAISGATLGNSYVKPFGYGYNEQMYFGGVIPGTSKLGNFGFGLRRFAVTYQGVDLDTETTYTLAHGINVYEDLHTSINFGTALNFYSLEFGETVGGLDPGKDTVAGFDVGLLITLHERTRLGVMAKNVNNPQIGEDNEEIGSRLHGGVAYLPYEGVTTTFEFENTLEGETQYHMGLEFSVFGDLFLRGGVMSNPSRMTGGFGYAYQGFMVNYGYSSGGGVLDATHQFGLTFAWGGEAQ